VTGGMEFNSACETDRGSDMVEKVVKVEGVLSVWWRRVWFAWHVRSCPLKVQKLLTWSWVLGAPTMCRTGTRSARHPAIPLLVSYATKSDPTDSLECGKFSNTKRSDYHSQPTLDPRVPIRSIRRIELISISHPLDIRISLNIVELQSTSSLDLHPTSQLTSSRL
jgi:hypothetical protein